jgi:hypothetical protein
LRVWGEENIVREFSEIINSNSVGSEGGVKSTGGGISTTGETFSSSSETF